MITSSGSVSSRIVAISSVEPSTLRPPIIRIPRLRGSSSTKPIAVAPRSRVELQLADHHLAAGAGADDEHLVLGQAGAPRGALDDQPHGEAGAGDQHQGEHEVDHLDRARQACGAKGLETAKGTTRSALETATARTIRMKSRPLT